MNPSEVSAISEIKDVAKIRVVLYHNGRLIHVPLAALVKDLQDKIDALDARVTALEP